ncbi:hypothetical protein DACRYDRAFT_115122 [Dacryopinax primogenitus]|uniref:Large ribosomal subunit protein bL21m n=1 Tax=Dacryopinax primogenitus (strain DJM 731) TaxID=1858805 RepID=M5G565_DACPD|nr:uncharacterized protein DACRYDRAFT_115122 [Dacryopinax primogenitus]EJU03809.1 hypothetical protein DACRYDRAFT_115122 [Dacryopinax primogenitus]
MGPNEILHNLAAGWYKSSPGHSFHAPFRRFLGTSTFHHSPSAPKPITRAHIQDTSDSSLGVSCTNYPPAEPSSHDLPTAVGLLRKQISHYAVASLHGRKYLLTPKDLLTVPRLKNVAVGQVLCLDKIHELGSRDYTLRGDPCLPDDVVSIAATVVEHTKGDLHRVVKKKRRKGYKKMIEHKQPYTRLRIGEIVIGA